MLKIAFLHLKQGPIDLWQRKQAYPKIQSGNNDAAIVINFNEKT